MNECLMLMTNENRAGREIIKVCMERHIKIPAIIAEVNDSPSYQTSLDYLRNDFYEPPTMASLASRTKITVHYVDNLNSKESQKILKSYKPELAMLGGARRIKKEVIDIPKIGIINAHPGFLPLYKGLNPVQRALADGVPVGVTTHFIDEGLDTGPILLIEQLIYPKWYDLIHIRIASMQLCAKLMAVTINNIEYLTDRKVNGPEVSTINGYSANSEERVNGHTK